MVMEIKQPSAKDCLQVMKEICSVNNPFAFCNKWQTEKPKLFNKFMDMLAWYRQDKTFLLYKVLDTEFMYHKRLKKDVLVSERAPEGFMRFWDDVTHMWVKDKSTMFSQAKEKHS
jgi:hypothetical protein